MWLPSIAKEKRNGVGENKNGASPRKAIRSDAPPLHDDNLGSHAFAQQILRSVFVGQIIINKSHTVVNANRAAELLVSPHGSSELIGQHCSKILPREVYDQVTDPTSLSRRIRYTLKPYNSTQIPVDISTSKLSLHGEQYTHILLTALSEKFGLFSSLVQTQRLANIGTLTTSIIHELTNPMSAVATATATMLQHLDSPEFEPNKIRDLGDSIQRNTERCRMIMDVIRQHIHTNPAHELGHLEDMVNNALMLINNRSRKKHSLSILVDVEEKLPLVRCNPNQITQVILNLVLNAEDVLGSNGGAIKITAKHLPELNAVGVFVEDNGSGIDPNIIDEIFEPFFTTKPQGIGMGMGLYISSEIAKIHKGWLKAQNLIDDRGNITGAKFSLLLPT